MLLKKIYKNLTGITLLTLLTLACSFTTHAKESGGYQIFGGAANMFGIEVVKPKEADTGYFSGDYDIETVDTRDTSGKINNGIFIGNIDVSGMSFNEAKEAVNSYFASLRQKSVNIGVDSDNLTEVTAGQLGLKWQNENVVIDAINLGKSGNVVKRYKELKDLERSPKVYELEVSFDTEAIKSVVESQAKIHNINPVNASMSREDGVFRITEGRKGYTIDVASSISQIENDLLSWSGEDLNIYLEAKTIEPKGKLEDLEKVKDVLGSFTTSFSSSSADRSGNVRNGTKLINGTLMYPGDSFSTYQKVSPFTEENGYFLAGSYSNGMVVETFGGGICQVSSTLYNAVLRAELQVDERSNHSMIVSYVKLSSDAAISGTSKDFKFTNNTDYPIYIEGYTTEDKSVVFNIYGVETRPSNRTIEFESVELDKTELEGDKIVADSSQPVGFINVQSPHIGYVGEFWKIVKVDGVETERTRVNKSSYQATQRTATVGTASDNPSYTSAIQSAIASGIIEACKEAIARVKSGGEAASTPQETTSESVPAEEVILEDIVAEDVPEI